ncbi:MAG: PAC2 family protein [Actinobacteria bacterium]|nr:PAC2 family protein [Actinomycetota bacterium]
MSGPVVVAAFQGWNDAGEAASGAARFLAERWAATVFARIDPEDFFDFQVNRPTVRLEEGVTRTIEWPASEFHHARVEDRDVVLFTGIEPNVRWRTFASTFVDVARGLGAERLVTRGAFLADVPHTRPVPITGSAYDPAEAQRLGLATSRYEGPTGIVGVLHDASNRAGLPSVSLWAATPHYAPSGPNPKATLALIESLASFLAVEVDPGGLPGAATAWEEAVSDLTEENEPLAQYVRRLEEAHDPGIDAGRPSAEGLAAEVERFLREQGGGQGDR